MNNFDYNKMIQKRITEYYKSTKQYKKKLNLITNYYKKVEKKYYGFYNNSWHCLKCGIDMGCDNPRQYCKKFYCDEIIL